MVSVFGPIVTGASIRRSVEATLRAFMPDYLAEVGFQAGRARSDLPMFRSWVIANDLETWPENQLPACVIISPGLDEEPTRNGSSYHGKWSVAVGFVVSSKDREATKELVELYAAAVRACLLQHPSLPNFDAELGKVVSGPATAIQWLDESYDDADEGQSRTLGVGRIIVSVEVDDILDIHAGISQPSTDPSLPAADPVTIRETNVDMQKVHP